MDMTFLEPEMSHLERIRADLVQRYDEALEREIARGCAVCRAPATTAVEQQSVLAYHPDDQAYRMVTRVQVRCDDHAPKV